MSCNPATNRMLYARGDAFSTLVNPTESLVLLMRLGSSPAAPANANHVVSSRASSTETMYSSSENLDNNVSFVTFRFACVYVFNRSELDPVTISSIGCSKRARRRVVDPHHWIIPARYARSISDLWSVCSCWALQQRAPSSSAWTSVPWT